MPCEIEMRRKPKRALPVPGFLERPAGPREASSRRIVAGFCLATLSPGLALLLPDLLKWPPPSFGLIIFFILGSTILVGPAVVFLGVPTFLHLRDKGWLGLWQHVLAGGLAGVAYFWICMFFTGLFLLAFRDKPGFLDFFVTLCLLGTGLGMISAATLWGVVYAPWHLLFPSPLHLAYRVRSLRTVAQDTEK